jgi:hypothetical protein
VATEADIEIVEDNDAIVVVTCRVDGAPVNLTGAQVDFFLKPTKATAETDSSVVHYSTDTGEITLRTQSGGTLGQVEIRFVGTDVATPEKWRYRLDVTQAERRLTYAFGRVVVIDV